MKSSSKFTQFHSRKCTWKCLLRNGGHFVSAWMCLCWNHYCFTSSCSVKFFKLFVATRADCNRNTDKNTTDLRWHFYSYFYKNIYLTFKQTQWHERCAKGLPHYLLTSTMKPSFVIHEQVPISWGPFYWYWLTLIPVWISNHMPGKVWWN